MPTIGATFELSFGPGYDWQARVTKALPGAEFELQMLEADADGRVSARRRGDVTQVSLYHAGWPDPNEHWRISDHWRSLYHRSLRRYLECGERVPYEMRLDV